ncbi:MAG: flagellar hook-basal body complex protein FliE [Clostridia bacterium]|nr:flagellar hook-basal body complex protein FliE [Clostridia bacterium]
MPIGGPQPIPLWQPGSRLPDPAPASSTGGAQAGGAARGSAVSGDGAQFLKELQRALEQVNALQIQAEQAGQSLASGSVDDVARAMIAAQKASLALDLTVEVRNRALEAYQEIMRMQV